MKLEHVCIYSYNLHAFTDLPRAPPAAALRRREQVTLPPAWPKQVGPGRPAGRARLLGSPRRGWTGKGCSAGPSPPPTRARVARGRPGSGSQGAARWTVRGRLCRGLGAHWARCVPGSALGARCGPHGSCGAGGRGGPAPGPRGLGPTLPGDVSLETADAVTHEDCFPSSKRAEASGRAPGTPRPALPGPGPPGPGSAERQVHPADRGRVCFLSGDFSARPGHRCAVPSSERRAGTEPSRRPPARPGCPSPRLGQTSWACSVCKPIINAICRNENIPLKCVFEQVLEKTRREREHLWWRDASKCPGPS